jgi:hypothetical protein
MTGSVIELSFDGICCMTGSAVELLFAGVCCKTSDLVVEFAFSDKFLSRFRPFLLLFDLYFRFNLCDSGIYYLTEKNLGFYQLPESTLRHHSYLNYEINHVDQICQCHQTSTAPLPLPLSQHDFCLHLNKSNSCNQTKFLVFIVLNTGVKIRYNKQRIIESPR